MTPRDTHDDPPSELILSDDHLFAGHSLPASTADIKVKVAFIKAHLSSAYHVLSEIHDRKEYKSLGYSDWASFVRVEFGLSAKQGYRLIKANEVNRTLTGAQMRAVPERVARVLSDLSPADTIAVAVKAKELASKKVYVGKAKRFMGKITAPIMEDARRIVLPGNRASDYIAPSRAARPDLRLTSPVVKRVGMTADMTALVVTWEECGTERHILVPLSDVLRHIPGR